MPQRIARFLDIHEKEIALFLWTLALLFIVRSSGIVLNNYAETVFLKRYGVETMPVVNMINAVLTVVVMGIMAGLMHRFPGPNLLAATFLFTGGSIMAFRLTIPLGFDLVYPILFMLKALYEVLLAMLFWNLANDLFNTRQSKRLFPLITAGGVVGQILGSFGTPLLVRWIRFDNLLVVYLLICIVGAVLVWAMMRRFPTLLMAAPDPETPEKNSSMVEELRTMLPLMRKSLLFRLMVLLTLMPNVVIPIINYQFNYAVDQTYASEAGLIEFFGYFRGILNIISLVILLFVGRIYGRWGLPVALMFHPLNYILAFAAFFLRFDVYSAIYARMSTNIIRTTINIPANAVMMGLFPESFRAMVRPFLRGTMVRIGLFVGSGLILIGDRLFHPRFLSLVALPFVLAWLVAPILLKRRYAAILSDLIKGNQLDLKSMEESDLEQLFRDQSVQTRLVQAFLSANGPDILWYAQLLQRIRLPDLDRLLLQKIKELSHDEQIDLLEMMSSDAGPHAAPVLSQLAAQGNPLLTVMVLKTVYRLGSSLTGFDRTPFLAHPDPKVRAFATAGLLHQAPEKADRIIRQWLADDRQDPRKAGVIAAGLSKDPAYVPVLTPILQNPYDNELLAETITALHDLGMHEMDRNMLSLLQHEDKQVRLAALSAFHVRDRDSLKTVVGLLADPAPEIRRMAAKRIEAGRYVDGKTLVKALSTPNKEARELIFDLLNRLQIKDTDVYRFARDQIEGAYKSVAENLGVRTVPATPARALLLDYLDQQKQMIVENVLRVLAVADRRGRMRIISRGLMSTDNRQRANSQEALDDLLDRSLSRILMPLLDDAAQEQLLAIGRKRFKIPDFTRDSNRLFEHLLQRDDALTVLLTLQLMSELDHPMPNPSRITALTGHDNPHINKIAQRWVHRTSRQSLQEEYAMAEALMLPNVILLLKNIEIFEQLAVNEMAAVASVTEEVSFPENHVVIQEGDAGNTLFMIIEGQVAVLKNQEGHRDIELDRMGAGDYFGEMALFEDIPRTATIRTLEPCRMLVLHKQEFKEMVREYPQIALDICKVLSGRIRKLHAKMTQA